MDAEHLKNFSDTDEIAAFLGIGHWKNQISAKALVVFDEALGAGSVQEACIRGKIKGVLMDPGLQSICLIQFWAARPGPDGQSILKTSNQPFCMGSFGKGLCLFRKKCCESSLVVTEEDVSGPVGRVFRTRRPESTPDLCLYSPSEFPLSDYAVKECGLSKYLAVPVLDSLNTNECYGVLEMVSLSYADLSFQFHGLSYGLQEQGLRSTHINFSPLNREDPLVNPSVGPRFKFVYDKFLEMEMLETAIAVAPQLCLVQVWKRCEQCKTHPPCMERTFFITAAVKNVNSTLNLTRTNYALYEYLQASEFHNLQISEEMGTSLKLSNGKLCLYRNLSESRHPLAHYARTANLTHCLAFPVEVPHLQDTCIVEFIMDSSCGQDAFADDFRNLLFMLLERKLTHNNSKIGFGEAEEVTVVVAKHEGLNQLFHFYLSSGLVKLEEQVALNFRLEQGSFKLTYLGEGDDLILLHTDVNLKRCVDKQREQGRTPILLEVLMMHK